MFGHFKIQGHSGTSQKHRKGFQKRIEYQKNSILNKKVNRVNKGKPKSIAYKGIPYLKFIKLFIFLTTLFLFIFILLKVNESMNNYVTTLDNEKEEIPLGKEAFYTSLQDAEQLPYNHEYKKAVVVIKEGMRRYDKYINSKTSYISRVIPLNKSKKILNEILVKSCAKNPESCEEMIDIIRDIEAQLELELY